MASDIEIAKKATLKPVTEIATALGIDTDRIELYGRIELNSTGVTKLNCHWI